MLLSVFTPSHDHRYLSDCYYSLIEQSHQDFEWVVVPNGEHLGEVVEHLKQFTQNDPRVRVIPAEGVRGIGALKRFACEHCRGEVLVELDHDDLLTRDCLSSLAAAAQAGPPSFFFSDSVGFYPDHRSEVFDPTHHWQTYPYTWRGRQYTAMRAFPVTARSLCEIFYAPNHVRAWSKVAYHKAGGHDASMPIGDDHDLICRTYLAGIPFVHVGSCLYMYRRHERNSCVLDGNAVWQQQLTNMNKYLPGLVAEWCRRQQLSMLDLGGAHNCPPGFISVDKRSAELVCDLTDREQVDVLIDHNSVGCFRAVDFLEHIPLGKVVGVMNTLYEKLAPGGWIMSETPSTSGPGGEAGRGAFMDPTHLSFWNSGSFQYYTDRSFRRFVPEIECRFQAVRLWTDWPSFWHRQNLIPYVYADLVALKGQLNPGPAAI